MRIVKSYGNTLLDYLNNDKSVEEVLTQGPSEDGLSEGAKRTLRENGIILGKNSKVDASDEDYNAVRTSTNALRNNAAKLVSTKEGSLFAKAQESGKTEDLIKEIKELIKNYNDLTKNMDKIGGQANSSYVQELDMIFEKNADKLKEIGIEKDKDGTIKIDSDKLEAATVDQLKELFNGDSSFAEKLAQKSVYIEANAVSAMYTSKVANYTSNGMYSNDALSSFLKSI